MADRPVAGIRVIRSPAKRLIAHPVDPSDVSFWMEGYRDPILQKQMYARTESPGAFWEHLQAHHSFTIWAGAARAGGFTITAIEERLATFGIWLEQGSRGQYLGSELLGLVQAEAVKLCFRTLRADVYSDNAACLAVLGNGGFREFVWLEKT